MTPSVQISHSRWKIVIITRRIAFTKYMQKVNKVCQNKSTCDVTQFLRGRFSEVRTSYWINFNLGQLFILGFLNKLELWSKKYLRRSLLLWFDIALWIVATDSENTADLFSAIGHFVQWKFCRSLTGHFYIWLRRKSVTIRSR